jgi:hypothetical protein
MIDVALIWLIGFWLTFAHIGNDYDDYPWDWKLIVIVFIFLFWPSILGTRLRK